MNSASARLGSIVNAGMPGMNASSAPPSARSAGYGAPNPARQGGEQHRGEQQGDENLEFIHASSRLAVIVEAAPSCASRARAGA